MNECIKLPSLVCAENPKNYLAYRIVSPKNESRSAWQTSRRRRKKRYMDIHCVSKKFPPLNSLKLCQILTDFQNFCTAGKRIKFATKPIRHYPPYLRHVATLPWEIKNSNFRQIFSRHGRKCKQIAFLSPLTLLLIHKF